MRDGHRIRPPTGKIDYKQLRKINPETARMAVLEYLRSNGHNISQTALVFGINRPVIYDILQKEREKVISRTVPGRRVISHAGHRHRLKIRLLRLNVGPDMGQKDYRAISSNMKVYRFLQGQSGI